MSERAILLGPRRSLVGVVNDPREAAVTSDDPLVVFLNSGIIHRIGGNRLTVEVCREIAKGGVSSLRFDLSAIGDSRPREDALDPLESAMADVREVLDHMERNFSARRFVLAGLCSGADHSIAYATRDSRVVGLILIDPSVPRTGKYYVFDYVGRMRKLLAFISLPRNWPRLRSALGRLRAAALPVEDVQGEPRLVERPYVRSLLENAYSAFVRDGRRALVILSAGIPEQHNYAGQFVDAFPQLRGRRGLDVKYVPDTDHTFTSERHREALASIVRRWLTASDDRRSA